MAKHTIALIFDFDDTLVPDSTTALLASCGVDPGKFWLTDVKPLISEGWDPVHAYLKVLLDLTRAGEPLEGLTSEQLRDFGAKLQPYQGLPSFFERLKKGVKSNYSKFDIEIEYYVISGGLEEVIRGCKKISRCLTSFWGCRLGSDPGGDTLRYIKRTISFTEKTRYIFEINKGLKQSDTDRNPMLVNQDLPQERRRVPIENMIYVGDGLTDIPCFSLVTKHTPPGMAFGVMHKKEGQVKQDMFEELVRHQRVRSIHSPNFAPKGDLASMLTTAVYSRCTQIQLSETGSQAYS